jgi:hypothetical protein
MSKADELQAISDLIDEAKRIVASTADWEVKYRLVFGLHISMQIRDAGFEFTYYDPDTSYEEDVEAYMCALERWRSSLGNLVTKAPDAD